MNIIYHLSTGPHKKIRKHALSESNDLIHFSIEPRNCQGQWRRHEYLDRFSDKTNEKVTREKAYRLKLESHYINRKMENVI